MAVALCRGEVLAQRRGPAPPAPPTGRQTALLGRDRLPHSRADTAGEGESQPVLETSCSGGSAGGGGERQAGGTHKDGQRVDDLTGGVEGRGERHGVTGKRALAVGSQLGGGRRELVFEQPAGAARW